jgi:uncharacterized membrane protein
MDPAPEDIQPFAGEEGSVIGKASRDSAEKKARSGSLFWAYIAAIVFTLLVVPLIVILVSQRSIGLIGVYLGSTFVFQAGAVGLISLSPNKVMDFIVVLSIGLGFILAEFTILDVLAKSSSRVKRWIDRVEKKAGRIKFIKKYGIYTLIPLMWIPGIGLYGGAVISWILEFNRPRSIVLLFIGWFIACLAVLSLVLGILNMF